METSSEKRTVETPPEQDAVLIEVEPPPDGGLQAWTQVVVGHLVWMNSWGYISSYAFFESYYIHHLKLSPSALSWAGSLQLGLVYVVGTFSGRAMDAGYFRSVLILGCALQILAVFMTSLATEYWQLILAQGICGGLGQGCVFCPMAALVSGYFTKKRGIAMNLVATGTATGGLVFPVIAQQLLPRTSFGWTVRVMGFVMLGTTAVIVAFARPRVEKRKSGPLVEWSAFKETPYTLFILGACLYLWGTYIVYQYYTEFGETIIHLSRSASLSGLLILNGIGFFGRIIPGLISDYLLGPFNTLIICVFITGMLQFCWMTVSTPRGFYVFTVFFGFALASVQGMLLAGLPSLTTDLKKMGTRTGMILTIISIPALTGSPLAGALITQDGGSFQNMQIWAGTVLLAGGFVLIMARMAKTKGKLIQKM